MLRSISFVSISTHFEHLFDFVYSFICIDWMMLFLLSSSLFNCILETEWMMNLGVTFLIAYFNCHSTWICFFFFGLVSHLFSRYRLRDLYVLMNILLLTLRNKMLAKENHKSIIINWCYSKKCIYFRLFLTLNSSSEISSLSLDKRRRRERGKKRGKNIDCPWNRWVYCMARDG